MIAYKQSYMYIMPKITIPAVATVQNKRKGYLCSFSYIELCKFFQIIDEALPLDQRHQRQLSLKRTRQIGDYILQAIAKKQKYIIPPLVASLDSKDIHFEGESVGQLTFDLGSASLLINDGQHRRKGIEFAIEENPDLESEQVGVFLIPDVNLKEAQQMFSDINQNAKPTGKSLNLLFDHRTGETSLSKSVRSRVKIFERFTELEKNSPPKDKLFVFSKLHGANMTLMEILWEYNVNYANQILYIANFWQCLENTLLDWKKVLDAPSETSGDRKKLVGLISQLKAESIAFHGVTLQALAKVGEHLLPIYKSDADQLSRVLQPLAEFSLAKANPDLLQSVLIQSATDKMRVVASKDAVIALSTQFLNCLNVESDPLLKLKGGA
jgi:DNA sulfur modification protein DndB